MKHFKGYIITLLMALALIWAVSGLMEKDYPVVSYQVVGITEDGYYEAINGSNERFVFDKADKPVHMGDTIKVTYGLSGNYDDIREIEVIR